jgi:hypothetical protein
MERMASANRDNGLSTTSQITFDGRNVRDAERGGRPLGLAALSMGANAMQFT